MNASNLGTQAVTLGFFSGSGTAIKEQDEYYNPSVSHQAMQRPITSGGAQSFQGANNHMFNRNNLQAIEQ